METKSKTMRVWNHFIFVILAAVLTSVWGCSSDDETVTVSYTKTATQQSPNWVVDMHSNDEMPSWDDPDLSQFENSMYLLIKLQEDLVPYSTSDDRMACFINDECRSVVAHRSIHQGEGGIYFPIKVLGNSIDHNINFELRYYSGGLHQLFSLTHTGSFIAEMTYGIEEDFEPYIMLGSTKYPVGMNIFVNTDRLPFKVGDDDLVAAFVGDECRCVSKPGQSIYIFAKQEGEQAEIRYYSSLENCIYTLKEKLTIQQQSAANAYEVNF